MTFLDIGELRKIATHARSMREAGFTLLLASAFLAVFLFIPLMEKEAPVVSSVTLDEPEAPGAFHAVPISASAAIVYDLATNEILYEKNATSQLPLASLTKILTVYAAFATLSPTTPIVVPESAHTAPHPRVLRTGQIFSLSDLARLTLTASLNDGAVAIAAASAKSMDRSEHEMLASAAAALGLSQTYALNGSGLDVSAVTSGGYGSALDLALLAGALLARAPEVALATTRRSAEATSAGGTTYAVQNTDPIIDTIPRLLLSKTGYTDLAGGNLVLAFDAAMRHPIAVVVLGSSLKERFTDASALVAATLAHFANINSL